MEFSIIEIECQIKIGYRIGGNTIYNIFFSIYKLVVVYSNVSEGRIMVRFTFFVHFLHCC